MSDLFIVTYPQIAKYAETAPVLTGNDASLYDFDQIERCPQCGQVISGARWIPPRKIVLTSRKVPDFLYTYGSSTPFLLSAKAFAEIRNAGLTGIKFAEPIDHARYLRKSKKEVAIPNYYYIEVEKSRITIDQDQSVTEYCESPTYTKCPLCCPVPGARMAVRNLHWNMEEFEHYDIFQTYEMRKTLFVSKRFVEFCKDKGLTNLHCCPSSEWKFGYL